MGDPSNLAKGEDFRKDTGLLAEVSDFSYGLPPKSDPKEKLKWLIPCTTPL
jgi:hypothetical protein